MLFPAESKCRNLPPSVIWRALDKKQGLNATCCLDCAHLQNLPLICQLLDDSGGCQRDISQQPCRLLSCFAVELSIVPNEAQADSLESVHKLCICRVTYALQGQQNVRLAAHQYGFAFAWHMAKVFHRTYRGHTQAKLQKLTLPWDFVPVVVAETASAAVSWRSSPLPCI